MELSGRSFLLGCVVGSFMQLALSYADGAAEAGGAAGDGGGEEPVWLNPLRRLIESQRD